MSVPGGNSTYAHEFYVKLSKQVQQIETDGNVSLTSHVNAFEKSQKDLKSASDRLITRVQSNWINELNSLKNEYKNKGIDISGCLGSDEVNLLKQFQHDHENMTTCYNSVSYNVKRNVDNIYNRVSMFNVY